ncbi:hypothetical protein BGZ99_009547 [Dissophora globulifera]|uniref:Uncharacterized protein n=1 Tax=Dissophora globulifera TaxID=979702 RepID=A0A9P6R478_9FUNG|nr:hypothetical protein BGZ99_009547 [Dissophora globulifera]
MTFAPKSPLKRSCSPFSLSKNIDTGHELDYIPFAKSSKTFVKQNKFSTGVTAIQFSEDQELSPSTRVPGMGEFDPCSRDPLDGSEASPFTRKSQEINSPSECNFAELPSPLSMSSEVAPGYLNIQGQSVNWRTTRSIVEVGPDLRQKKSEAEVVVELPPPRIGNRIHRKPHGSGGLNGKYSRMVHEMGLMTQGIATGRPSSDCLGLGRSATSYTRLGDHKSANDSARCQVSSGVGGGNAKQAIVTDSSNVPQPTLMYDPLPSGSLRPLISPQTDHDFLKSKLARFDEGTSYGCTGLPSNISLGAVAYSTPHFRLSKGSFSLGNGAVSANEDSLCYAPYSAPNHQGDVEFDDDPEFENVLLKQEPFLEDAIIGSFSKDMAFLSGGHFKESAEDSVARSNQELIAREPPMTVSQGLCRESVLDERPMTIRERIHKMGSEIRASAGATVLRLGTADIPGISIMDFRRKRDTISENERQRLRQQSRFGFSGTVPSSIVMMSASSEPLFVGADGASVGNTVVTDSFEDAFQASGGQEADAHVKRSLSTAASNSVMASIAQGLENARDSACFDVGSPLSAPAKGVEFADDFSSDNAGSVTLASTVFRIGADLERLTSFEQEIGELSDF